MKLRPINILEMILALLFFISHILWISAHIHYMGLITVSSGGILCILYFYLGFLTLKSLGVTLVSSILYGVAFGLAINGLMFTFQHWPYTMFEITFGLIIFAVLAAARLIAVYLLKRPTVLQPGRGITIRYMVLLAILLYAFITLNHH